MQSADGGVVIEFVRSDESSSEWTMIELQGVLEPLNDTAHESTLVGQALGTLRTSGKDATLVIGSHELTGKLTALPKPLVMTRSENGKLIVMGVVKQKYVFKTRPNIVMN